MSIMVNFHSKKSWAEILLLSMKTCMLSLLNSEGNSNHILEQNVVWLKELSCLKWWYRSTKIKLKPVHVLVNICFLMSYYLGEWVRNERSFFPDKDFTIDGLLEYGKQ